MDELINGQTIACTTDINFEVISDLFLSRKLSNELSSLLHQVNKLLDCVVIEQEFHLVG